MEGSEEKVKRSEGKGRKFEGEKVKKIGRKSEEN